MSSTQDGDECQGWIRHENDNGMGEKQEGGKADEIWENFSLKF